MLLSISYSIYTITFILKLIAKKVKLVRKFIQKLFEIISPFSQHPYLRKFFYNVTMKKEYKFSGFKFKDLYKIKKYTSLSFKSICICLLILVKNYVHINLSVNLLKIAI